MELRRMELRREPNLLRQLLRELEREEESLRQQQAAVARERMELELELELAARKKERKEERSQKGAQERRKGVEEKAASQKQAGSAAISKEELQRPLQNLLWINAEMGGAASHTTKRVLKGRAGSSVPSCVSLKSDMSMNPPLAFRKERVPTDQSVLRVLTKRTGPPLTSRVSVKSDDSMDPPLNFREGPFHTDQRHQVKRCNSDPHEGVLSSIFKILEEKAQMFLKDELRRFRRYLDQNYPECSEPQLEEDSDGQMQKIYAREGALKITLYILRTMEQNDLADMLEKKLLSQCQHRIKCNLKKKCECIFEGKAKEGQATLLNKIYTELYITEGGTGAVNDEHEVRQIETASKKRRTEDTTVKCNDIFKPLCGRERPIRTVLTKGVAGIGKTVSVQKFILDWAEGKSNQDVHFIFALPFRDLNLIKDEYSLIELLHHFIPELNSFESTELFRYKVLFIFDGLDECRLPLHFRTSESWCDVKKKTSLDVLLINLIKGNLLPSALLWITSRPAAANQIPPDCIHRVTEIRGFSDAQKEEYFRRRFSDQSLASRIITHVKSSKSLFIMCHIPVFCWISATVLEKLLSETDSGEIPRTLTDMYTHFLIFQSSLKNDKYMKNYDIKHNKYSKEFLLKLGKLAFDNLEKGNLIFYEQDLTENDIDVSEASVHSGVCTEVFKEEYGLYREKVYCFVHLSIQEYLAALYVFLSDSSTDLLKTAVDQALKSKNGHLDLYLRFLLGLSTDSSKSLLQWLLAQTGTSSHNIRETAQYIKEKIQENLSSERTINLFHCLNELGDNSLVEELERYLNSGRLSAEDLSPAQYSALAFVLLMSDEELDVFDLKKFVRSDKQHWRLLPVVKTSRRALLDSCNLTVKCCEALASALRSNSSPLRELDLSDNDLQDSGVKLLSAGLGDSHCKLGILRLSGCRVTEEGCSSLASALRSNPSHLRELDLSYNHPGDSGVKRLSAVLEDPSCKLEKLNVDHSGECRTRPGLQKYSCQLTLDPNTANRHLSLSGGNRKVTEGGWGAEQPYPDHPERFDGRPQVLCRESLTGRCYWEAEWDGGGALIGVTYKGIRRKGWSDCLLGFNSKSWSLRCFPDSYSVWHNNKQTLIPIQPSGSRRVGVYLDWGAGALSFYRVSSDGLTLLYRFTSSFTEPLCPGFAVYDDFGLPVLKVPLFKPSPWMCRLR